MTLTAFWTRFKGTCWMQQDIKISLLKVITYHYLNLPEKQTRKNKKKQAKVRKVDSTMTKEKMEAEINGN